MYKNLILKSQGYDSEEENRLESVTDFNNHYDGEKKCKILSNFLFIYLI